MPSHFLNAEMSNHKQNSAFGSLDLFKSIFLTISKMHFVQNIFNKSIQSDISDTKKHQNMCFVWTACLLIPDNSIFDARVLILWHFSDVCAKINIFLQKSSSALLYLRTCIPFIRHTTPWVWLFTKNVFYRMPILSLIVTLHSQKTPASPRGAAAPPVPPHKKAFSLAKKNIKNLQKNCKKHRWKLQFSIGKFWSS